nr:MAG TPA: hypothetical protein [Caudoviricetes sp.]
MCFVSIFLSSLSCDNQIITSAQTRLFAFSALSNYLIFTFAFGQIFFKSCIFVIRKQIP